MAWATCSGSGSWPYATGSGSTFKISSSKRLKTLTATSLPVGAKNGWLAAANYYRTVRRLERGLPLRFSATSLGFALALALGLMGLAAAASLLVHGVAG